jgi:hypothetical protein
MKTCAAGGPLHYMGVSGQFHAPVALQPEERAPVPIVLEAVQKRKVLLMLEIEPGPSLHRLSYRGFSVPNLGIISFVIALCGSNVNVCRSEWPRGLTHGPFLPARTLGSWVQIPLEAWLSGCVYSVFVLFCV